MIAYKWLMASLMLVVGVSHTVAQGGPALPVPCLTGTCAGGFSVRALGVDMDNPADGVQDVAIGAPLDLNLGGGPVGSVMTTVGLVAGGGISQTLIGQAPGDLFGWAVHSDPLFDVNGDGFPELLVGSPTPGGTGNVMAIDIRNAPIGVSTAAPLWVTNGVVVGDQFGFSITTIPDLTGDGIAEVIVGAPGTAVTFGSVACLDGSNGTTLSAFTFGAILGDQFGFSVAGSSNDAASDMVPGLPGPEFAVGAPIANGLGSVVVMNVNPVTFAMTAGLAGFAAAPTNGDLLGFDVALVTSSSGAVALDVAAGAPAALVGGQATGTVTVFRTGGAPTTIMPVIQTLLEPAGVAGSGFGFSLIETTNSGTGAPQLMVGAPAAFTGTGYTVRYAFAVGAAPYTILSAAFGGAVGDQFGQDVANMPLQFGLTSIIGSPGLIGGTGGIAFE